MNICGLRSGGLKEEETNKQEDTVEERGGELGCGREMMIGLSIDSNAYFTAALDLFFFLFPF